MSDIPKSALYDFKGLGYSKIGYFKEVRSKIKELERLNVELAQRHNKLEAIFNSMSDGLTILDLDLNIVFVNDVQKSMFQGKPMIGKKCYKAFYGRDSICPKCSAVKTLDTHETIQGEAPIKKGDYTSSFFEWIISPIKDHYGKTFEILILMRDITGRKEYEVKLMQSERMAAIGFLAAGIAHELNNPLTSIAGFSEGLINKINRLRETPREADLTSFREYLEIINDEAHRCKDIIKNLVEFSRQSTDDYKALNVEKVIKETLSLIRQYAKDNKVKIAFKNNLTSGFDHIIGNNSQIRHLFLSVLSKMFKTITAGGDITVVARNKSHTIEIDIGYPVEFKVDPFQPLENQIITDGEAINMSIWYNIVKKHNGEIEFKSTAENRAAIVLVFPVLLP